MNKEPQSTQEDQTAVNPVSKESSKGQHHSSSRKSSQKLSHNISRKSRIRKTITRLLAIGMGLSIGLILCEIGLRLFVDQETKRLAIYDPDLGWRGRPFGRGTYIRSADNIRVDFRYNNLGFRDEDVGPKPDTGKRLLMIGDSFIENLEVEYSETFPALVETDLKVQNGNWDACIVGSQGYSTAQELKAFRRYKSTTDPDLVLLFVYCGNDFEDNLRPAFSRLNDKGEVEIVNSQEVEWKVALKKLQRWAYESSHVVFLLKNKIQSWTAVELGPASKSQGDADEQTKRDITCKLIRKMADEVEASGMQFGVVVIPFRDELVNGNSERPDFVVGLCESAGIACLDLSPKLSKALFFETDVHFNVQGHRVVADAVVEFVAQMNPKISSNLTQN